MKYYHATPRRRLVSIMSRGLLTEFSNCKRSAIYLFTDENGIDWAREHIALRHHCDEDDVVILCVFDSDRTLNSGDRCLRRHGRHNLWYYLQDIPPGCITITEL